MAAIKSLTLSSVEIRAAVGELEGVTLAQRTLADWVDTGLVTPSVRSRSGHGVGLVWTLADLARVRLVAHLRKGGISLPRVRAIFAYLERDLQEVFQPRSTAVLVVADARAYIQRPGQPDIEVPGGQLKLFKLDALFVGNVAAAKRAMAA